MAGKTTPWWRDVLTRAVRGIRAGVAAFFRPVKKPGDLAAGSPQQEKISEEEAALSDHSPHSSPDVSPDAAIENLPTAPEPSDGAAAPEEVLPDAPVVEEAAAQTQAEDAVVPQPVEEAREQAAAAPDPLPASSEEPLESPADLLAEAALGIEMNAEPAPETGEADAPEGEPEAAENDVVESVVAADEAMEAEELAAERTEQPELAAGAEIAVEPELAAGPEEGLEEPGAIAQEQPVEDRAGDRAGDQVRPEEGVVEMSPAGEPAEQEAASAEAPEAPVQPEAVTTEVSEAGAPAESRQPMSAPLPPKAAAAAPQVVHEPIKREQGPDTSPVSVLVSQVYEGPFDLLLDLIRKQDIDIYDIPIAKITAQFLAYVNQLKASDMDVAGEFIYTASLLIHIKSKMLLPREPKGGDEAQEDPRRELVERLLEHERFKNAAQMLQQKQMLEAATWTNPGLREFREKAGESEIGPEIAADTTDLVRIFRVILERARSRPMINVEEDSVTVGQMIQFLGRRLTMEDKPVALGRLLAHTKSERALIAMFLALLELVRLQAILLRQDRHFSEIFIKKNSGFEGVMNQGVARDDWQ